jgi:sulfate transporter 4
MLEQNFAKLILLAVHAGSFSRSAVNHESGAKTGLSGIIMGIIIGSALLFMTPLFTDIPQVRQVYVIMVPCF